MFHSQKATMGSTQKKETELNIFQRSKINAQLKAFLTHFYLSLGIVVASLSEKHT